MEGCRLIAYPLVGINESTCTPQPIPAKIGNDPRIVNIIIRITERGVSNYPDFEEIRKGVERRVYKARPYNQNDLLTNTIRKRGRERGKSQGSFAIRTLRHPFN